MKILLCLLSLCAGSAYAQSLYNGVYTAKATGYLASPTNFFRSNLVAGAGISIAYDLYGRATLSGSGGAGGETNTASNLGSPSATIQPWFFGKSGVDLQFRSMEVAAGGGLTLHSNASTVVISNTVTGAGEANTASNLGTPSATIQPLFFAKSGVDLQFRSLEVAAGGGLTFHSNATTLIMSNTVAGGSGDNVTVDGAATVDPNFDDGGDINFAYAAPNVTATVKADSVALMTDTTGNYVLSLGTSALTGLTGGSGGSEGAALTLALDYSAALSGDIGLAANATVFGASGMIAEGATADTFESFWLWPDPGADRTFTWPDRSGTVMLSGDTLTGDVSATFETDGSTATTVAAGITRDTEWDTEAEVQTAWGGVNILLETEIDASSELLALMDDETGTGVLVFNNLPTFGQGATAGGAIKLAEDTDNGANVITVKAPDAVASDKTATFPDATGTVVLEDNTATLTGKTFDAAGTGNTLKSKGYIYLLGNGWSLVNGVTVPNTNDLGANTFMRPLFSNSADEAANYVEWRIKVPPDIDTAVDLRGEVDFELTGADILTHRYVLSMDDIATSAGIGGTMAQAVNLDFGGDALGAANDVEQVTFTTLTSWKDNLTAGRYWVIRLARDGNAVADGSATDSRLLQVTIEYSKTQ